MSFKSKFESYFTEEELQSSLVQTILAIGTSTEKSILEELTAIVNRTIDISRWDSTRIRSWLSAQLRQIPHYLSSRGTVALTLKEGDSSITNQEGSIVRFTSASGLPFYTTQGFHLDIGSTVTLTAIQGEVANFTGTYSKFLKINDPKVDLSSIVVTMNSTVPLIIPHVAYKQNKAVPQGGYYAFVSDGSIYIKIYPGPSPDGSIVVPSPEDAEISVSYSLSDGVLGNISSVELLSIDTSFGVNEVFSISHSAFISGANPPKHYELVNYLRYSFYSSASVSSIPEYTAWLKARPEVGDCVVEGDYAKYLRTNSNEPTITGTIQVSALNKRGIPIVLLQNQLSTDEYSQEDIEESVSQAQALRKALEEVKDLGWVDFVKPTKVSVVFDVTYYSSQDDTAFGAFIQQTISNYFSIDYCAENNDSLFNPLDVSIIENILVNSIYRPVGLSLIPYLVFTSTQDSTISLPKDPNGSRFDYRNLKVIVYNPSQESGYSSVYDKPMVTRVETNASNQYKLAVEDVSTGKVNLHGTLALSSGELTLTKNPDQLVEVYLPLVFEGKVNLYSSDEFSIPYRVLASTNEYKEGVKIAKGIS